MKEVSKSDFYRLVSSFEWIPYTQTDAYCRSIVDENTLHYFVDDIDNTHIGCVGYERRKAGLKMLCISGECLKTQAIDRKLYAEFYKALQETGFDIYELQLNTPYNIDAEIALRTSGWLRPIGMFSTTLSKVIATNKPLSLDRSWKHNMKKAHEAGLHFMVKETIDESTITEYVSNHQELLHRKGFSDGLSADGLRMLSSDPHYKIAVVCNQDGQMIAGHIFYAHPIASSSIYAFTSLLGRESGAAYMLYEGIINYLAQHDIHTFDVGRLSPAAHKKNNLFLFKDGIGGEYVNYLGEWEYTRRRWISLALLFMKKYIWKRVRV